MLASQVLVGNGHVTHRRVSARPVRKLLFRLLFQDFGFLAPAGAEVPGGDGFGQVRGGPLVVEGLLGGEDFRGQRFRVCGADHMLFGSSFPVVYGWMSSGVDFVQKLDISEQERELILNGNARRLFRLDEK